MIEEMLITRPRPSAIMPRTTYLLIRIGESWFLTAIRCVRDRCPAKSIHGKFRGVCRRGQRLSATAWVRLGRHADDGAPRRPRSASAANLRGRVTPAGPATPPCVAMSCVCASRRGEAAGARRRSRSPLDLQNLGAPGE
jgi:hypothetical protein